MKDDPLSLRAGPLKRIRADLEIVSSLGRIGDGLVYAGRDRGVPVRLREFAPAGLVMRSASGALKPVDEAFGAAWRDGVARFLDQGRRLAGFSHPGLASISRVEADEHLAGGWLVGGMTGASLRDILDAGVVFTPADTVRFAGELADVLAELHGRGMTHLDIAPETVSTATGCVQLRDFAVDNRPFIALLHSHDGLVRPGYSPIEHYDAGMDEPLGPAADVHAAGALVYRLVTGREPPPWQERWRYPEASELPERDDYPPGFLAAIRKGMAIEPADRFTDGRAWRDALGLPAPAARPASRHPPVRRPRARVPAIAATILLLIALLGFLAWRYHWLNSGSGKAGGNVQQQQQQPERISPVIRAGDTVSGDLGGDDPTGPGGGFRDGYRLQGRRGDRIAIRLRPDGFEPLLSLFGPGLAGQQGEDGRTLTLTLPQVGTYTILVGAARAGATGPYSLEVVPAGEPGPDTGPVDPAVARRLAGTWHEEEDDICKLPAVNIVQGDTLTVNIGGEVVRHRINVANTNEVDTVVEGGRLDGRSFHFRLAPDGRSYDMDGESWTRC